jgi:hypothetical protein
MATIKISYKLDETGRRASLLAGGNGREEQTVDVEATPELMALATVDAEGRAGYYLADWGYGFQARRSVRHQAPLAPADAAQQMQAEAVVRAAAVVAEDAREAREKAKEASEKLSLWRRLATEALRDRSYRTRVSDGGDITRDYGYRNPHTTYASECGAPKAEIDALVSAWAPIETARIENERLADERDRASEAAAKARAQAAVDERDAWIRANGSRRLRKGLDAGLVDQMRGVYRDERIAHALGVGWIAWKDAEESEIEELLNPDEARLDALAEAQARFPAAADVRLRSVGIVDEDGGETTWRPALVLDCPWDLKVTAIKYL